LSDFLGNFWIGRLLVTAQNIQKKDHYAVPNWSLGKCWIYFLFFTTDWYWTEYSSLMIAKYYDSSMTVAWHHYHPTTTITGLLFIFLFRL